MIDTSPSCDVCPHDAHRCLAEGWRVVDRVGGTFRLRFSCPRVAVALKATHAGIGRRHVVDDGVVPGGIDVARGLSAYPTALYHAADASHDRGYFRPLDREAIAATMAAAYVARFSASSPR